jgi:hypothetical protein
MAVFREVMTDKMTLGQVSLSVIIRNRLHDRLSSGAGIVGTFVAAARRDTVPCLPKNLKKSKTDIIDNLIVLP